MYSGTVPTQPNGQQKQLINYEKHERSAAQLAGIWGELSGWELHNLSQANYKTYQEMLSDPTIAFARMLCVAPLTTVGWSYEEKEGAPDGAKECIQESLEPWRIDIIKSAMEGYIDYGWAPYEMVYSVEDNQVYLCKVKPLLQYNTLILVAPKTGEYLGLRQYDWRGQQLDLGIYDSLHIAIDVAGTNWYGRALLENARIVWDQWNQVNAAANKYDTKVAGASWVVYYPVGESPYNGIDLVDNFLIATDFLNKLQANGRLAVPMTIAKWQTDMNVTDENAGWKIELISDKGAGSVGFVERQKYLDALKVRAFGLPERAVLEGQFGTKAESEAQADFAITVFEMRHQIIVQQINRQVTNFILATNYGEEYEDTVMVKANPLVDEKRLLLEKIYMQILTSPDGMMQELQSLDMETFRKQLDLPENPLLAQNGMPAAQGMLSEYFAELYGLPKPQPTSAAGINMVQGPAVIPPEYWQAHAKGLKLAFDESKHPRVPAGSEKGGQFGAGGGSNTSAPSEGGASARESGKYPSVNSGGTVATEPKSKNPQGYSPKDAKKFTELNSKWADLNNQYLALGDKYGSLVVASQKPEANDIMKQQQAINKERYTLNADPGGVAASIGKPGGVRDMVVIGGGPGGMEAALMAGTEGLDTVLLEATERTGGQSRYSSRIENFAGFPIGIKGDELANLTLEQAARVGADVQINARVKDMTYDKETGLKVITMENGDKIQARTVVIGGGIKPTEVKFPGADSDNVVYMDGQKITSLCEGKNGVIIGGSNGAAQAALGCAEKAEHVYLVSRSPIEKSMSANVVASIRANKKITVVYGEIEKYEHGWVHTKDQQFQANGVGVFIGGKPDTAWVKDIKFGNEKDPEERGKLAVNGELETSMPGVYAVGDVRVGSVPRIAVATGDGALASAKAFKYLRLLTDIEKEQQGGSDETKTRSK